MNCLCKDFDKSTDRPEHREASDGIQHWISQMKLVATELDPNCGKNPCHQNDKQLADFDTGIEGQQSHENILRWQANLFQGRCKAHPVQQAKRKRNKLWPAMCQCVFVFESFITDQHDGQSDGYFDGCRPQRNNFQRTQGQCDAVSDGEKGDGRDKSSLKSH